MRNLVFPGKIFVFFSAALLLASTPRAEGDCSTITLSDIGWTDVSATTAVTASLLSEAGYQPKIILLSLPVTLTSLKNADVDVFLGNWMPSQTADVEPFLKEGSIEVVSKNLSGAKYTLAVPSYTYDAGLKSFADIHRFAKELKSRIYGIESGNEGNRVILKMINSNDFHLKDFRLIESSEQGMLLSAKRAFSRKEHVVLLGWAPHPMNTNMSIRYLSGGDKYFGANFGEASVFTLARKNFSKQCPKLAHFFRNLRFDIEQENEIMRYIIDDGLSPNEAANKWLASNSTVKNRWLSFLEKRDPPSATRAAISEFPAASSLSIHDVSSSISAFIDKINELLSSIPAFLFILVLAGLIFALHRSFILPIGVAVGFGIIHYLGLWNQTIQTLTLVFLSIVVSSVIGIPAGIWLAKHPRINRLTDPILNMMQTVPTFVYLIPTLLLFGLGVVPGLISTVIFSVVAPIRLTRLGISSVPAELIEVADAFGATKWQKLFQVELKSAMPLILEGISQCVMLSLSMVVIAALVGAEGLGAPVIRALNTVDLVAGAKAGAAIVILAAILDKSLRRGKHVHS